MLGTGKAPEDYQIEDFVTDESFINYFFQLNIDDKAFWEKWLVANPHLSEVAMAAKSMLSELSLVLPEQEFEELSKIRKAIHYRARYPREQPPIFSYLDRTKPSPGLQIKRHRLLKLVLSWGFGLTAGGILWLRLFTPASDRFIVRHNDSAVPQVFSLSDGTVVTLAPQGVFRYPSHFGGKERKVFLDGEAQFHVTRDEAHPFKVYEGDLVAPVLGLFSI